MENKYFQKRGKTGKQKKLPFNFLLYLVMFLLFLTATRGQTAAPTSTPVALTESQRKLVNDVNNSISIGQQLINRGDERRISATGIVIRLSNLSTFPEVNEPALRNIEEITQIVKSVSANNVIKSLNEVSSALTKAKGELTKARDALPPEAVGLPLEISAVRITSMNVIENIDQEKADVDKTKDQLQKLLPSIPSILKRLIDKVPKRLDALNQITEATPLKSFLQVLSDNLPILAQVQQWNQTARLRWNDDLRLALKTATNTDNAESNAAVEKSLTDVDGSLAALDTAATTVIKKIPDWTNTIIAATKNKTSDSTLKRDEVIKDPLTQSAAATTIVKEISEMTDAIRAINTFWVNFFLQLRGVMIAGFDAMDTNRRMEDLTEAAKSLNISSSSLQDALAGNAGDFESDRISLFYYTEVERIMKMLNPATYEIGGIKGVSGQAAIERKKLTEAELDLITARGVVAKFQTQVQNLEEDLRVSKAKFSVKDELLRKSTFKITNFRKDNTVNLEIYNRTKTEADGNPDDSLKKAAFDKASADYGRSQARLRDAEVQNKDAQRERDEANDELSSLNNDQLGLPSKIREARNNLEAAQTSVDRQRRTAILTAQAENEAFALARDNRPFLFGPAVAASNDPAKRILMYAFSDDKTIFLRGKPDDLKVVKNIISQFDRPAPQARLTLWTLEMSSDTSPKGTDNFNKGLKIIEEELSNNRALTAATLSYLRDCINLEVNRIANSNANKVAGLPEAERYRIARLYFYQPEVLARLGASFDRTKNLTVDDGRSITQFSRLTIPDPAGTTTLGESLMILSLANSTSRKNILDQFQGGLPKQLKDLGLYESTADLKNHQWAEQGTKIFPSTMRALGMGTQGAPSEMPPMQLEVVKAAEKLATRNIYNRLQDLAGTLNKVESEYQSLPSNSERKVQLNALRRNLVNEIIPQINWLRTRFGFNPYSNLIKEELSDADAVLPAATKAAKIVQTDNNNVKNVLNAGLTSPELNPLRLANAREAAADQMLKELIIAFEDDLDRHFMQPMINRLREKVTKDKVGVGVGVMQRTSMLATNRLLARVDPRASAELGVGEEVNILESVQQLAQIALTWQAGGPLAALGAADAVKRQAPPEIYGITTGNTFQVTPIFDPSGQALRFKFDFLGVTNIQEPNGSTSRALPRIERHTINTEVQLSNLEMREISRFESNSRIGRPTEYSGGVPIFRDIPVVKQIPLIGWFVRRGGKAAVIQQSLIFGQTTMYPTIGDIMDLLTEQPVSFGRIK